MIWIRTIPFRGWPRVTRIRAHVPKRLIPRIRSQHAIPDRREVGKRDIERGILGMKRVQTVKDDLEPVLTPGILGASTIIISNQKVSGIGRGLREEGDLTQEIIRCFGEMVSVICTCRRSFMNEFPIKYHACLQKESTQSL